MSRPFTIVAAHGNGGGGLRFALLHEHLPSDVRLRAPTLPGFPDEPADPALTDVAGYAEALAGHVLDAPRPRVVLGHGIGGAFALDLLQRHAGQVDGVILHAPVGTRLDERALPRLMRLPGATRVLQHLIAAPATRPLLRGLALSPETPVDVADRMLAAYGRCAAFGTMFRIIDAEWFDSLAPVDVPAVLLWGEDERVLAVEQVEDYRALLPRAEVVRVPAWDHFPMLDDPRAYARRLADLARGLVDAPAA